MYEIGTHLAHPGHGGCTVQELCYRTYGGEKTLYFVLTSACDPYTKILVPVEKAEQAGLRRIISSREADQILAFLADEKTSWDGDHKHRKQSYEATAKGTDLFALARMIKELLIQETKVVLGSFEKGLLPRVQKRLFSEIALAKGMGFQDTMSLARRAMLA